MQAKMGDGRAKWPVRVTRTFWGVYAALHAVEVVGLGHRGSGIGARGKIKGKIRAKSRAGRGALHKHA
jgi:hypothetical protein